MPKLTKTQTKVMALEKSIKAKGVRVAYERLQFSGLILRSGLCWFRGNYHIFVDRHKTPQERYDFLEAVWTELQELENSGRLHDHPQDENISPSPQEVDSST